MNYAKKYVEYLIDHQAQSIQAAPAVPTTYNLPGLRTFSELEGKKREVLKRELESAKDSLVAVNKKIKSTKSGDLKSDLKARRDDLKRWIVGLQFELGRERGGQNAE